MNIYKRVIDRCVEAHERRHLHGSNWLRPLRGRHTKSGQRPPSLEHYSPDISVKTKNMYLTMTGAEG
jgi:hypothetical protein